MTNDRRATGQRGEGLAEAYLRKKGYRIQRRNYRCPVGEIDLVAEDGDVVVIVEVRTRRVRCMVSPEETVNWTKANRLIRLGEHYLVSTGQDDRAWRVDVVAIEVNALGDPVRIDHYENATEEGTPRR